MSNGWDLSNPDHYEKWKLPMVEVFETVEGEGSGAGFPTIFVRVFHCNLRCTWCDTPYSYAPAKPEYEATVKEIAAFAHRFASRRICFTGGEPLMHREKSAALLKALALPQKIDDVHIETNGAIDLIPFHDLRQQEPWGEKVRFVMDYKLPASGEADKMIHRNFNCLKERDEVKFVIGNQTDFLKAVDVIKSYHKQGQVLFSPVFEKLSPRKLVEWVLAHSLSNVRVSLQLHKFIWDPAERGV
ncbi:7-carboxy-7-deazaguanine synthase QueE [Marininema halotolerans]|uniref:7-carboxy-7-deazaguanine synthase n=1 Tax=Marininema halotolerans TaxID=1155944 RepID=A0A1I6SML0_9BACL|nr:radical SAM protein [Marininema halotolerans]SFS78176.1 7-carboxy-7-deazaguanine synthase [Marininema halotolerans]